MSRAGLVRAEGETITSAGASDKVLIQKYSSVSGQYEPREITVANLLTDIPVSGDVETAGDVIILTAGKGLKIKEGSNARMGRSTLSSGTVTVSNTSITASTEVFITRQAVNGATALGIPTKGTVVAGTSFVINSLKPADATVETGDASIVSWVLIEPAA